MWSSVLSRVHSELAAALTARGSAGALRETGSLAALLEAARGVRLPAGEINRAVAKGLGGGFAESLSSYPTSSDFVANIPIGFARQHGVLGLAGADGELFVALGDPGRGEQLQVIAGTLGKGVSPRLG